jgi:hypothetical protein
MEQKSGLKHFGGFWGFLKRGSVQARHIFLTKNVPGLAAPGVLSQLHPSALTFCRGS